MFIDKVLVFYDDHPSIYYTGYIYRYFRNFKRVTRSDHGKSANELYDILKYEGRNCYIPSGNSCFLKCINKIFKKNFSMEYFVFIQLYKRRKNVMTRCRSPKFCERFKIDCGIYDPEAKQYSQGKLNRGVFVYTFIKIIIVLFGKR